MKKYLILSAIITIYAQNAWAQANLEAWQTEPGRIIGGSSMLSGARLMDPVMIDFDGDGIDDIVIGAPGMGANGLHSAGSIIVVSGKNSRQFEKSLDLTSWNAFDYRFDGHTAGGMLGMNMAAGDFNGDGLKDLAVAEPGGNGTVYIFYGGKKRERGIFDIMQEGAADFAFTAAETGSSLGISMCVGDFNRDGIDDIAMASLSKNSSSGSMQSNVTAIPMRHSWDKRSVSIKDKIYGKTVISRQVGNGGRVLHSCAFGDFNDDSLIDIALGMPADSTKLVKSAGSVTVIYNLSKYSGSVLDIGSVDEKIGIRLTGDQAGAMLGTSLASGDFTGDGRTDLAVSAPGRLIKGPQNEGAVYVLDASRWPKTSGEQSEAMMIPGNGGNFGFRLMTADVNKDTRPDLIISAPKAGLHEAGALDIYFGGPHFRESVENNMRPDIEIRGAETMNFGLGAAVGDFNGDGKMDAVVRTGADPAGRDMTGAMAVIGDLMALPNVSNLSDNFLTIAAPSQGGGLAKNMKYVSYQNKNYRAWISPNGAGNRSIICLTDASKTAENDVALAAVSGCDVQLFGPENYPIADFDITKSPTNRPLLTIAIPDLPVKNAVGTVAVIPLPETMNKPLVLNLNDNTLKTSAAAYYLDNEGPSGFGTKIEWNDIDGDGFDDLVIGAPQRIIDSEKSGTLFIVPGKAEFKTGFHDLKHEKVIQLEGLMNEELGTNWQILDFNQDGQKDIAVEAQKAINSSNEPYASVYVVSAPMQHRSKAYTINAPEIAPIKILAPQMRAGLRLLPQNADLNGDGFSDLVLLSPRYNAGLQKVGGLFAVYSSAAVKSGELKLSDSAHTGFSFITGRNEMLKDAAFLRTDGRTELLIVTADLMTNVTHTLNSFIDPDSAGIFSGRTSAASLKRTRAEARIPENVQLIVRQDADGDALWLLYPDGGITQSGQGIAKKVRLKPAADVQNK